MAYDRYDQRREGREPQRWREEGRDRGGWNEREGGRREERGWFERAGEQIAHWFGDEEDDDRSRRDRHPDGRGRFERATMSDEDFSRFERSPRWRDEGYRRPYTGRPASQGDSGPGRSESPYRPMTGDYGRNTAEREQGPYGARSSHPDRHYDEWRRRQLDELDRDYADYHRERQQRFESDFGSWRAQRQSKRQMLGQVREHFEVVGSDEQHVGTVDRVAGDRIILTKSDPDAGGAHHSVTCTSIDRVEGNKVFLDVTADQARNSWRDESRDRALFEREDQGEAGPHMLNRSFSGTY